jgi:hypothetical protein
MLSDRTNPDPTHETNEQMFSYVEGYCKLETWKQDLKFIVCTFLKKTYQVPLAVDEGRQAAMEWVGLLVFISTSIRT